MALINRPLTEDEVDAMLASYREGFPHIASLWDRFVNETTEPKLHVVRYSVNLGVRYCPPTEFHWSTRKPGPSDCVWIVPGT